MLTYPKLFLLPILCLFAFNIFARPDINKIIDKLDNVNRSNTAKATLEMIIETPHYKRSMVMDMISEGLKKTFIVISAPRKNKGFATLRIDKEMWNYMPRINKTMKIPPSMMMSSWMGSDFTNDDLVKESSMREDYTFNYDKEKPEDENYYYIEMLPKSNTASVWGKIRAVVDKKELLPVLQDYYDEKGKKMRQMEFSEIKVFGQKKMPSIMKVIPLNKNGHSTTIVYKSAEFDVKLDKDTFTLRNLRKRR